MHCFSTAIHAKMTQHRLVLLILMVLNSATAFMSSSKTWNILSFQEKSFPHQLNVAELDRKIERGTNIYPASSRISVESYQHTDFKLTYLYKKAAPGREFDKPICLVHPVGIGISSWFWVKLMEAYEDNPPIYAPDLIGCGIDHGADPWDPNKVRHWLDVFKFVHRIVCICCSSCLIQSIFFK